jgi:hypothetical protein
MNEMERFTVLRQRAVGEKVKIGSGIYIDGGMLGTSEYLTPEPDVTYILERDGKEWTAEPLGQTLIGLDDPTYVFRIEPL